MSAETKPPTLDEAFAAVVGDRDLESMSRNQRIQLAAILLGMNPYELDRRCRDVIKCEKDGF